MQTLQLDEKTAQELYPAATAFEKKMLEQSFPNLFGKTILKGTIIERTPTVEAALAIAGETVASLTRPTDAPHETAVRIIEAVIEVLWEGKECLHSDKSQHKYEPRFIYDSGVGLRYHGYDLWYTITYCGPRLCYPTYDIMIHGVKILEQYYITYINFK
jgi:hypothetical protein